MPQLKLVPEPEQAVEQFPAHNPVPAQLKVVPEPEQASQFPVQAAALATQL